METTQLFTEMQKTWHSMKDVLAEQEAEIAKYGEASAETKAAVDRLNERIDTFEVKAQRAPILEAAKQEMESKTAFIQALRYGVSKLTPEQKAFVKIVDVNEAKEIKALSVMDDTTGGYLAPSEWVPEIIKEVILFSPLRDYARVRTTSNRSVIVPVRKGTFTAAWVTETGTRSDRVGLSYGREEIPTHEMFAEVIVSEQDLEDVAFDLEAEIRMEIAEQMGVLEGASFVTGSGTNKPEGILTNASVATTNNGHATILQADALITIAYDLKDAYAKNATWAMRRATIGAIRKLKDSQNQYLWQPGLSSDRPNTILDRPYVEVPDMPAVAAAATPILFGDIRRAYTVVDRVAMVFKRLNEKYAETGQIAIIARRRVGGQVVLAEAVRKLSMAV